MNNNSREFLQKLLYNYFNSEIIDLIIDKESNHYGACTFKVSGIKFLYRAAKITPTKIGQFVTVWKRSDNKITTPYSLNDNFDYYVISVQKNEFIGYFIFPINVMYANGIIADQNNKGGKRGFRVYPIWDKPANKQAERTQKWQIKHFLECSNTSLNNEGDKIKLASSLRNLFK